MKYKNHITVSDYFKKGDRIYDEVVSIIKEDLSMRNFSQKGLKIWMETVKAYPGRTRVHYEVDYD